MPISIDWGTKVINVPKDAMTLLQSTPKEIYELDVDVFRQTLNDLQDDEEGMPFDTTHQHNTSVTVGGVTLARTVEIINGYTVTFEDGQYRVVCTNANHNLAEVTNVNQVSVTTTNSAGLVEGVAQADVDVVRKLTANRAVISPDDLTVTIYDDDGVTPFQVFDISADKRERDPQ
jgi:hypothetical protein